MCLTTLRLSVNFPRWGLELQSFGLTGDRVARFSGRKMPENEAKVAILENFNDFFLEKLFIKNAIKSENLIYRININFSCFYLKNCFVILQ